MASRREATATRRADRRAELGARLLAVGEELIERGVPFSELNMSELAAAAGISRSTVYFYFEGRSSLLYSLGDTVFDELGESASQAWAGLPHAPDRADVRAALDPIVEAYLRHPGVVVGVGQASEYDPDAREIVDALHALQIASLSRRIEAQRAARAVRKSIDAVRVAAWLVWMIDRGIGRLVIPADDAGRERLLTALVQIVWRTLYAEEK